ncbi:MAG: glycosyltransferase, partial [Methanobacteriaceae archaeon]|nr:glycosyltransferase [Methanobacteriaceae archaeon]
NQTIGFENLEIIMVNDHSTDQSGKIIDQYASKYKNFKAIHLPTNSGSAGKPRNIGIENATSQYMMFLDPDDYYTKNACEILYNKINKEKADIVFGKYKILTDDTVTEINLKNRGLYGDEIKIKSISDNTNFLRAPPSVWTRIYNIDFIKNNAITFPEGIPGQDLVFAINAVLKAKGIIFLNTVIAYYRIRSGENKSISFNRNKKYLLGLIEAYTQVFNLCKEIDEKYFSYIIKTHLNYWSRQFILSELSISDKKEILENSAFLFEKYGEYGLKSEKRLITFFESVYNKEYDNAISLSFKLADSIKKKEIAEKLLKSKIKEKKIFMLCDRLHIKIGGLARVVLARSKLLAEKGHEVTIITIESGKNYKFLEQELRKRRELFSSVNLINIYDYYKEKNTLKAFSKKDDSGEKQLLTQYENNYQIIDEYESKKIISYFKNNHCVKIKKWDDKDSSEYVDYFNNKNILVKREKYINGFLSTETSYDPKKIRQKKYLTEDGFCYLTEIFDYKKKSDIILLSNRENNELISFKNINEFHKYFLTELCEACEEIPYLICDGSGPLPTISDIDSSIAHKIVQLHSNPYKKPYSYGSPMRNIGILKEIGNVDAFITLTKSQRKDIIKEFGDYENTYVIPNFVKKTETIDLDKIPNKISVFSRISPEKRVGDAIKSFKIVVNKRKNAQLEIFGRATLPGEIKELKKIEALIKELKLENNVHIKGYTNNVYEEMAKSAATLVTSMYEGFGMVIIESMMSSTPVISYDLNYGPSEIIDHGINGFLVEYNNIDQMAAYIIKVLDDVEKAEEMGIAARKKVFDHYTDEIIIPKWERILKNVYKKSIKKRKTNIHKPPTQNKFKSIFSKIYPLYILFRKDNGGIKNAFINIRGYRAIKKANLLDYDYYFKNNPDVKLANINPILHYIYHGFKEGRNPNKTFNGEYYLRRYSDVKKSNLNPLIHYSLFGKKENRKINKY